MWPLTGAFLAALEVQWRCAGPGHAAVTPVSHLDWWSYEASCSEPAAAVCVCNVYNQAVLVNCSSLWGLMMMINDDVVWKSDFYSQVILFSTTANPHPPGGHWNISKQTKIFPVLNEFLEFSSEDVTNSEEREQSLGKFKSASTWDNTLRDRYLMLTDFQTCKRSTALVAVCSTSWRAELCEVPGY